MSLLGNQEGRPRSLHKAKNAPKKCAEAQEGRRRSLHKAKKATTKLEAQEGRPTLLGVPKNCAQEGRPTLLGVPKKTDQEVYIRQRR